MLRNYRLHCKQVIGCPGGVIQAESMSLNLQVGASALMLKPAAGTYLGLMLMPREFLLLCPVVTSVTQLMTGASSCGSAPKPGEQRSCMMM